MFVGMVEAVIQYLVRSRLSARVVRPLPRARPLYLLLLYDNQPRVRGANIHNISPTVRGEARISHLKWKVKLLEVITSRTRGKDDLYNFFSTFPYSMHSRETTAPSAKKDTPSIPP